MIGRLRPLIALAACIALAAATAGVGAWGGQGVRDAATIALINMIMVVGLYVFVGNSGVVSFGHMAFAAVGAYTAAILTVPVLTKGLLLPGLPDSLASAHAGTLPAILIGGGAAALVAAIIGVPLMRLNGIGAAIGSLALLVIVYTVFRYTPALTGGENTLTNVPVTTTLWTAFGWAALAIVIAFLYQRTRFGLALRAARDEEVAAQASGVGVFQLRWAAFVISAFVFGVGGVIYTFYIGSVVGNQFYVAFTFQILAMLVVGGVGSLSGAVVGTVVISAVAEIFRRLEVGDAVGPLRLDTPVGLREVVLGAFMLAILILRPRGITDSREFGARRVRRSGDDEMTRGSVLGPDDDVAAALRGSDA